MLIIVRLKFVYVNPRLFGRGFSFYYLHDSIKPTIDDYCRAVILTALFLWHILHYFRFFICF